MMRVSTVRRGFTLVEILVVIAIIGILAALTSAGVFVAISTQQRRNSLNTIRVLDKLLHDRWNEIITKSKDEPPSPAVMTLAGNDIRRARVIWTKVRLVEAFPQTYGELSQADPKTIVNFYIPPGQRKAHFNKYQSAVAGKTGGGAGESAACLLMILKTIGADGVGLDDQLRHAIVATDGVNKIDTLVDGWSKPLRFTRFDTSPAVQTANPATTGRAFNFSDPADPDGTLLNMSWYFTTPLPTPSAQRSQFENGINTPAPLVVGFHPIALVPPPPAQAARAFYVLPSIASNGKDGQPNTADDILSFQLRSE